MIPFDGIAPRIIYGEGVSRKIPDLLGVLQVKTVMAVYDQGVLQAGIVTPIVDAIRDAGYTVETFDSVSADPATEMIEAAARDAKAKGVAAFIAIGGGGVMDTAKCMAVLQTNAGSLSDYILGIGKPIQNACPPWIAVPTTSGTGSEVTCLSIVTQTASQRKVCVKDVVKMRAVAAYLDPALVLGLPKGLTAATGMDALSHAVEGWMAPAPRYNDFSDLFCETAVKRIMAVLPRVTENGQDLEARGEMMLAACFAGVGFANCGLHVGHALAHAIGASLHVPHGIACAWGEPFAVRHCGAVMPLGRLQKLASFLGVDPIGKERPELIASCEAAITSLAAALEIPVPRTFGIGSREEMERAFHACITNEQAMLQNGGAPVTEEELHAYFEELWAL